LIFQFCAPSVDVVQLATLLPLTKVTGTASQPTMVLPFAAKFIVPQPAPLARKADFTRWTMTAIAPKVRPLAEAFLALREAMQADRPKVRWVVDVDPYDFG
jgi:primosomal protein N'